MTSVIHRRDGNRLPCPGDRTPWGVIPSNPRASPDPVAPYPKFAPPWTTFRPFSTGVRQQVLPIPFAAFVTKTVSVMLHVPLEGLFESIRRRMMADRRAA